MEKITGQGNQSEAATQTPTVPNGSPKKTSSKPIIFIGIIILIIVAVAYFIWRPATVSMQRTNSTTSSISSNIGASQPPYQIFVPDFGSGNISVINSLNYAVKTIGVGGHPSYVIPIVGSDIAYVSNYGNSEILSTNSSMQAINLSKGLVVANVRTVSPGPEIAARNGSLIYFVNGKNLSVISVLSVKTNSIIMNISVPNTRTDTIAFSNDYSQIYVLSYNGNFAVVNLATDGIIENTSYPIFPAVKVVGGADDKHIYVLGTGPSGVVAFINKANYSMQDLVYFITPIAMSQSPNGKLIYVLNGTKTLNGPAWAISVVNISTRSIVKIIPINGTGVFSNQPSSIGVSPDGNYLYVDTDSENLLVINATNYAIIKTVQVGSFPGQIYVG